MQASELKEYLSSNEDGLIKVLEFYNFHSISMRKDEVRCAAPGGDNATAIMIKTDNFYSVYYSDANPFRGDIFGLCQQFSKDNFKTVIINFHALLGLSYDGKQRKAVQVNTPLSNLEKYINKKKRKESYQKGNKLYSKSFLDKFYHKPHPDLYKEAILPKIADMFSIGYDVDKNRITFPHFDWDNENMIVGVQGRIVGLTTDQASELGVSKYWNYIKGYRKSQNLYGWNFTKYNIQKSKKLVLFEAEKSVLKHYSYENGEGYSVALGGHEISEAQVYFILKNTPVDCEIILAFDKDIMVNEEYMKQCCRKFSKYRSVSYILDPAIDNKILGSKDSPIDKGYRVFKALMSDEHRIKVY